MFKTIAVLVGLALAAAAPSGAAVYYVDYARGVDAAAGTSTTTAWRHAPGDPAAGERAASAQLRPGDTVRFRGGVAYRGSIRITASGSVGSPLRFTGNEWGRETAIFDGADPVTAVPCPSSVACGGTPRWAQFLLVEFAPPQTRLIKFYDNTGALFVSQWPAPVDPLRSDEIDGYAVLKLADTAAAAQGRLRAPKLVALLRSEPPTSTPMVSMWVSGNRVEWRAVRGSDGETVTFDAAGMALYPTRDGRYALVNSVAAVGAPGTYAVFAAGRAVVAPRPGGGPLSLGAGRGVFNLNGQSHLTIAGFTFRRQTADVRQTREGHGVVNYGGLSTGITIENNRFVDQSLFNGQGVIGLRNVAQVRIKANLFDTIERGSGIRAGGNVRDVVIENNMIRRVGRTAIAFLGVADGVIRNNIVHDIKGVHGNGISLYLDNRRVAVTGNRVFDAVRPMTFHGDKSRSGPGDHEFVIANNIMLATPDGSGALISWGADTRSVRIVDNILLGPKAGALLSGKDQRVELARNIISGVTIKDPSLATWSPGANRQSAYAAATELSRSLTAPNPVLPAKFCAQLAAAAAEKVGGATCQ